MKRRLDALLRQRELLRQHLQWLDDEIAAAQTADTPERVHQPTTEPASASSALASTADIPLVEPVEPDSRGLHNEVRRGCLIYFAVAFILLAAIIAFIYWRYDREGTTVQPPDAGQSEQSMSTRTSSGQGLH